MDTAHMREFMTLAETLNYATASRLLFVSPSSLSRHIAALEDELGVQLFSRNKHNVALTAVGQAAYVSIKEMVENYSAFIRKIENMREKEGEELHFGMLYYGIGLHYAYPLIEGFRARYPDVRLSTVSSQPNQILAKLLDGSIDIGLSLYSRFSSAEGIAHLAIAQEPLVAIMPASHPLAALSQLSLGELATQRLIMMRLEHDLELHLRTLFRYHDLELTDVVYTEHIDTLSMDLEQSGGIFIGTRQLSSLLTDAVFVPVAAGDLFLDVGLLYHTGNDNPAVAKMLACV